MTSLAVEVIYSRSIFKGSGNLLQETMAAEIFQVAPLAHLVDAHYEPVVGALLLGLEACGIKIGKEFAVNIEHTSQEFGLLRAG